MLTVIDLALVLLSGITVGLVISAVIGLLAERR